MRFYIAVRIVRSRAQQRRHDLAGSAAAGPFPVPGLPAQRGPAFSLAFQDVLVSEKKKLPTGALRPCPLLSAATSSSPGKGRDVVCAMGQRQGGLGLRRETWGELRVLAQQDLPFLLSWPEGTVPATTLPRAPRAGAAAEAAPALAAGWGRAPWEVQEEMPACRCRSCGSNCESLWPEFSVLHPWQRLHLPREAWEHAVDSWAATCPSPGRARGQRSQRTP